MFLRGTAGKGKSALAYECMQPDATSVCDLKLLAAGEGKSAFAGELVRQMAARASLRASAARASDQLVVASVFANEMPLPRSATRRLPE